MHINPIEDRVAAGHKVDGVLRLVTEDETFELAVLETAGPPKFDSAAKKAYDAYKVGREMKDMFLHTLKLAKDSNIQISTTFGVIGFTSQIGRAHV